MAADLGLGLLALVTLAGFAYLFWRYVWFARDPPRVPPKEDGVLSPADGCVVYVRKVGPDDEVVVIKQGLAARISDIAREDLVGPKLIIGIFMSPFNVHYNRAPLRCRVEQITNHPGQGNVHMGPMHWRTLFGIHPLYKNSTHIVQNERTVTRFSSDYRDTPLSMYVVQIGAKTVNGIDSYFKPGALIQRGQTFGMIRIGSQVDLILPYNPRFEILVKPGDRVLAGETILIR
jgi:phosphatidylserine decarboxylase